MARGYKRLKDMDADELRQRMALIERMNPIAYPDLQSWRNTRAALLRTGATLDAQPSVCLNDGMTEAPLNERSPMFKLTGLSALQVDALNQVFCDDHGDGFATTASTATWQGRQEPRSVLKAVEAFMAREAAKGNTRHHPRASLHAVVRKLNAAIGSELEAEANERLAEIPAGTFDAPEPEQTDLEILAGEPVAPADNGRGELEATVAVEVAQELRQLERQIAAADAAAHNHQAKAYFAETKGDDATFKKEHDRMLRSLNTATTLAERRNLLQSPEEIARRVTDRLARIQQRERLNALRSERSNDMAANDTTKTEKAPKEPKVTAGSQGVPEQYLGENGNFRPGMDARAKSDLVLSLVGYTDGERERMLVVFDTETAERLIAARGWESFVAKRRESVAAKEAKAEARKAEAAAKVEAKKAAPKAKAAKGEVNPDPKPVKRSRSKKVAA